MILSPEYSATILKIPTVQWLCSILYCFTEGGKREYNLLPSFLPSSLSILKESKRRKLLPHNRITRLDRAIGQRIRHQLHALLFQAVLSWNMRPAASSSHNDNTIKVRGVSQDSNENNKEISVYVLELIGVWFGHPHSCRNILISIQHAAFFVWIW